MGDAEAEIHHVNCGGVTATRLSDDQVWALTNGRSFPFTCAVCGASMKVTQKFKDLLASGVDFKLSGRSTRGNGAGSGVQHPVQLSSGGSGPRQSTPTPGASSSQGGSEGAGQKGPGCLVLLAIAVLVGWLGSLAWHAVFSDEDNSVDGDEPSSIASTDEQYLAVLHDRGYYDLSDAALIQLAHDTCDLFDQGATVADLATMTAYAQADPEEVGFLAGVAVGFYCPEHEDVFTDSQ